MFKAIKRLVNPLEAEPSGVIVIETTSLCNLRCVQCPSATKAGEVMDEKVFESIVNKTISFAKEYRLNNWGEPLLHPRLYQLIAYIKLQNRNMKVSFFTNGNILNKARVSAVCQSGINEITVGLDGYDQESYEKHRRGGDFRVVEEFIRICAEERKGLNLNLTLKASVYYSPVLDPNIKRIEKIAKELGADEIVRVHYDGEKNNNYSFCDELFKMMIFDVRGRLLPCSHYVTQSYDMQTASYHTKDTILNHNDVKKWWQDSFFDLRRKYRENSKNIILCRGCHKDG